MSAGAVVPPNAPLLEVRGLAKRYRRGPEVVHALRGLDLTVEGGETVALVGPSGSGKTTLLSVLAGWEEADEGTIRWRGAARSGLDLAWSEMAIVPQGLGLMEELSIRENVELPARLSGSLAGSTARVDALLEELHLVGLADRLPGEVSIGEQQRAAVARALVLAPALLLADEPTGHQDATSGRAVLRALRRSAEAGTACVVATHNREPVRWAARRLEIRDGRFEPARRGRRTAARRR